MSECTPARRCPHPVLLGQRGATNTNEVSRSPRRPKARSNSLVWRCGVRVRQPLLRAHPRLSSAAANCFGMVIEEYVVELGVETNSSMRLTAALPGTARPIWEDAVGIVRTRG
jgi:hypothetical protein